jgi:menaquinone-dependent protoporphyrinogen oxidase
MRPILIVHASRYGQTEKIADRLAHVLHAEGHDGVVMRADDVPVTIDLTAFAGVIVAAPVMMQRHPKSARRFVTRHRVMLEKHPSAFVSVSGSAAGKELHHQLDCERMIARFLRQTDWKPTRTVSFAGAFSYTKYGPVLKWVMRRIAKHEGTPTDTSRDYEFTDWNAVDMFAIDFAESVWREEAPARGVMRIAQMTSKAMVALRR